MNSPRFLCALALLATQPLAATQHPSPPAPPAVIDRSVVRTLHSQTTGVDYVLKIQLPESYGKGDSRYPVLYLLDADYMFGLATDTIYYLQLAKTVPEMIIVSHGYGDRRSPNSGGRNERLLDYGIKPPARGELFLRFLKDELIPHVERTYLTDSTDRTLCGYSAGSAFAGDALFREPGLFRRYILIDGVSDEWSEAENAYFARHHELPATVFIAGKDPDSKMHRFFERIRSRNYSGLTLEYAGLSNPTHLAVCGEGLARGLRTVFGKPSLLEALLPVFRTGGAKGAIAACVALENNNTRGFAFTDASVGEVFSYLISEHRYDDAVVFGEFAAEKYPRSAYVLERLGDAYRRKGDLAAARAWYEKAVAITPDGTAAKSLKALTTK